MTTRLDCKRGLYVWNGYEVASNSSVFINECKRINVTDVYVYLTANNYTRGDMLRKFIRQLSSINIRTWGLDGARSYFNDVDGPSELYRTLNALITYNSKVQPIERFYGFQTDNECDDYSGNYPDTLHVDVKTSRLSKTSGGVFKKSAYDDRQFILQDWLNIQRNCTNMLRHANLKSGAALPTWLDNYYDEPLTITWNGKTQTMMAHMFDVVDEYVIMSYQTDLKKVAQRTITEMTYGNALTGKSVLVGVETNKGRGPAVTYGDHPTKRSKSAVLQDLATMDNMFKTNSSYAGHFIHDWQGWKKLPE